MRVLIVLALFLTGFMYFSTDGWPLSEEKLKNELTNSSSDDTPSVMPADQHRHHHEKRSVPDGVFQRQKEPQHRSLAYSLTLDQESKFRLSWTPDYERQQVHFRVDISHSPPQSWFALGFSDRGEWIGSDICVAWEDWKGALVIQVIHLNLTANFYNTELIQCLL